MKNEEAKKDALSARIGEAINKAEAEGKGLLIIREGEAEKISYPWKVVIDGVIGSPKEWFEKRKALHDMDAMHLIYDKSKGTITLVVNERFPDEGFIVKGALQTHPDLAKFKINTTETRTVKETMNFLKMNRIFFTDKDLNGKIVLSLQNFKAKVEQEIEDISDLRGNEKASKTQKLEAGLAESFEICVPLFKGQAPRTFKVDILCHINDGAVQIYFESRDLKEMEMGGIESIIDTELEAFKSIVCIEK